MMLDNSTSERPVLSTKGKSLCPNRGRPSKTDQKSAWDRIYFAAEQIIEAKGHLDVTDAEIAKAAGVSVAMINYYFCNKDGLLFALVDKFCSEISLALEQAESTSRDQTGDTRKIMDILVRAYYARPAISRIMMCEVAKTSSGVRSHFLKRYGSRALKSLKRTFDNLVEAGVYANGSDTSHAAFALLSLLNAPIVLVESLRPAETSVGPGLGESRMQLWIDYLTDLFDSQLKAEGRVPKASWSSARIRV